MNGGITLGGSISWGDNSSPEDIVEEAVSDLRYSIIRTLYYPKSSNKPSKPNSSYENYNNTSSSTWHKSFDNTKDRWLSRSFDGGKTWQSVEAITALTHIDATGIYTGTLVADNIVGGHISTSTFTNSDITNDYGYMDLYKQMIFFNENDKGNTKGDTKMAIGFLKGSQYNEPIIVMGAGDGNGSNIGYINKGSDNFSMYYKVNNGNLSYIKMYNNNGKASIRINGIEFEQQADDKVVYDFMEKADYWNNKLEAIKSDFKTGNKIVADSNGNTINISPENLGEMFTIQGSTIYLRPDVVLSWNAVYALYARTNLSKPTNSYSSYSDSSSTTWHKIANTTYDYYVSYSYDGGKTWSNAIQIKGRNGSDGADGSDANVPGYIKSTYIDFDEVSSPQIKGNFIMGGEVCGGKFCDSDKIGYLTLNSYNSYADLSYYRYSGNKEMFKVMDNFDNTVTLRLYGHPIGYGSSSSFYPTGTWNFTNATVSNLKITFG